MRLIDADKLCESIMRVWDFAEKNGHKKLANAIADVLVPAIVSQPTVDAQPVVHGHWETDEEEVLHKGSVCGNCIYVAAETGEEIIPMYYCDQCGAKMDEVIDNG